MPTLGLAGEHVCIPQWPRAASSWSNSIQPQSVPFGDAPCGRILRNGGNGMVSRWARPARDCRDRGVRRPTHANSQPGGGKTSRKQDSRPTVYSSLRPRLGVMCVRGMWRGRMSKRCCGDEWNIGLPCSYSTNRDRQKLGAAIPDNRTTLPLEANLAQEGAPIARKQPG